jgi:large subunit ribosomal protein L18
MTKLNDRIERRKGRVRGALRLAAGERKRLSVFRSSKHIYAQLIDDDQSATVVSASSLETAVLEPEGLKTGASVAAAKAVGKLIAQRAKEKGIKDVIFDRGSYLYHGRVKALADAAREAGLNF